MEDLGWYGFDLDATIAEYYKWKGDFHIGNPISPMIEKIKKYLEAGRRVKIVTARANDSDEVIKCIEKWTLEHIGEKLEITSVKDYAMIALYDDRGITVLKNRGMTVLDLMKGMLEVMSSEDISDKEKLTHIEMCITTTLDEFKHLH